MYVYVCVCVCVRNSSIDGHLHSSHVLAIVNNAAVNIGVHISLGITVFFGYMRAFQMALVVKNLSANVEDVRDLDLIPGLGRSPGGGHGNPLQCSCLGNPMDRGAGGLQSILSERVRHN